MVLVTGRCLYEVRESSERGYPLRYPSFLLWSITVSRAVSLFVSCDQNLLLSIKARVVVLFPCLRVSKQICFPIFSKTQFLILALTINFALLFLYSLS